MLEVPNDKTRGNEHELKHRKFHLNKIPLVIVRMAKHWNMMPEDVAESPCLEILKIQLDTALGYLL